MASYNIVFFKAHVSQSIRFSSATISSEQKESRLTANRQRRSSSFQFPEKTYDFLANPSSYELTKITTINQPC